MNRNKIIANNNELDAIKNIANSLPDAGIDTSDADAIAKDIVSGKTAYVNNTKITGTMANNGELNITPSTENISISEGYISGGVVTGDSNLTPNNIRAGVSIFGVEGNVEPDKPDQEKEVTPTTETQEIFGDIGYELGKVTVKAVDANIDTNIVAENIKRGVSILGVEGTLESGGTESVNMPKLSYVKSGTATKESEIEVNLYDFLNGFDQVERPLGINYSVGESAFPAVRCNDLVLFIDNVMYDNSWFDEIMGEYHEDVTFKWMVYSVDINTGNVINSNELASYSGGYDFYGYPSQLKKFWVDEYQNKVYLTFDNQMYRSLDLDMTSLTSLESIGTNQIYSEILEELETYINDTLASQDSFFPEKKFNICFDDKSSDIYIAYYTYTTGSYDYIYTNIKKTTLSALNQYRSNFSSALTDVTQIQHGWIRHGNTPRNMTCEPYLQIINHTFKGNNNRYLLIASPTYTTGSSSTQKFEAYNLSTNEFDYITNWTNPIPIKGANDTNTYIYYKDLIFVINEEKNTVSYTAYKLIPYGKYDTRSSTNTALYAMKILNIIFSSGCIVHNTNWAFETYSNYLYMLPNTPKVVHEMTPPSNPTLVTLTTSKLTLLGSTYIRLSNNSLISPLAVMWQSTGNFASISNAYSKGSNPVIHYIQ